MTDTQGTNVIGNYCGQNMRTPHIDKLAQSGTKFEHGYTTCPVCGPARSAIFSGLYPSKAGPITNNLALNENRWHMGQYFSRENYQTAYIGKWHLDGHDYFGTGACPDGWDDHYWYDGKRYLNELSDDEVTIWREKLKSSQDIKKYNIRPGFTWAHRISNKAIEFLDKHDHEKSFLLVASYDEPHGPCTCPAEYTDEFENFQYERGLGALDDLNGKPSHHREWAGGKNTNTGTKVRNSLYFGCNSYVDAEIGRLIDTVNKHYSENTVVIFTSDHGDMLGAHGISGKGPAMYEEITNIPFIVKSPLQKNKSVNVPVSHVDLLPTMLDMAGIPIPEVLDGTSLKGLIEGTKDEPDRHITMEFHRHSISHDGWGGFVPIRCIVQKGWKLVINLLSSDELYNLENDPAEVVNLIDDPHYSDVRECLLDKLLESMNETRDPFRGMYWERRSWRQKRKLQWSGAYRMKPDDGHSPLPLVYATGRPDSNH